MLCIRYLLLHEKRKSDHQPLPKSGRSFRQPGILKGLYNPSLVSRMLRNEDRQELYVVRRFFVLCQHLSSESYAVWIDECPIYVSADDGGDFERCVLKKSKH